MKKNKFALLIVAAIVLVAFIVLPLYLDVFVIKWNIGVATMISILSTLIAIFTIFVSVVLSKKYPKAFNVALIGFPKTGKTTLLTVLLSEIQIKKIRNCHATIKGEATIEKLHDNMKKLRNGIPVGTTTDETKFAYRTNITIGNNFLNRREYKVEFGDFPGESSSEFSTKSSWLKDTNFFNWAVEADAYLFAIDISICFIPDNYFPYTFNDIITGYISAWQHIIDNRTDDVRKIRRNPLVLVFTKSDIVYPTFVKHNISGLFERNRKERIEKIQNSNYFNDILEFSGVTDRPFIPTNPSGSSNPFFEEYMEELRLVVESDFKDLISYFKHENKNTKLIFSSAFLSDENSSKLGFNSLFSNIIPST